MLAEAPRGFRRALETGERPRVIAEIKRRSPSRGEIRPDFDAVACARAYASAGRRRDLGPDRCALLRREPRAARPGARSRLASAAAQGLHRRRLSGGRGARARRRRRAADRAALDASAAAGAGCARGGARDRCAGRDSRRARAGSGARGGRRSDRHQQPRPSHLRGGPRCHGAPGRKAAGGVRRGRGKWHLHAPRLGASRGGRRARVPGGRGADARVRRRGGPAAATEGKS